MNPIIQIFTIAEYEGYKDAKFLDQVPDYLKNLNAMHKVEKLLTEAQSSEYQRQLEKSRKFTGAAEFYTYHATAKQRAEAFLKTIGKWEK